MDVATLLRYEIYLSYSNEYEETVLIVYEVYEALVHLFNLKVVIITDKEINSNCPTLLHPIRDSINNSELFICMLNNDYCKSQLCMMEYRYAYTQKKPIIFALLDDNNNTIDGKLIDKIGIVIKLYKDNIYKCISNEFYKNFNEKVFSLIKSKPIIKNNDKNKQHKRSVYISYESYSNHPSFEIDFSFYLSTRLKENQFDVLINNTKWNFNKSFNFDCIINALNYTEQVLVLMTNSYQNNFKCKLVCNFNSKHVSFERCIIVI